MTIDEQTHTLICLTLGHMNDDLLHVVDALPAERRVVFFELRDKIRRILIDIAETEEKAALPFIEANLDCVAHALDAAWDGAGEDVMPAGFWRDQIAESVLAAIVRNGAYRQSVTA